MIFFTADTHFGYANIIDYSNRPYADVHEMNRSLIENWNSIVKQSDMVYHLGDFSFGDAEYAAGILRKLNGFISFIWGNHDKALSSLKLEMGNGKHADLNGRVIFLGNMAEIKPEGQRIVLNHYAMRVWRKSHRGSWHLYGHSHGSLYDDPKSLSFDVGVDCWKYFPISLQQVRQRIKEKTFVPVDHHR